MRMPLVEINRDSVCITVLSPAGNGPRTGRQVQAFDQLAESRVRAQRFEQRIDRREQRQRGPFLDAQSQQRYCILAVAEHFNKIDYERTTPITERCVYSLFPHFGYNPCWYVTRHTVRFIKVG